MSVSGVLYIGGNMVNDDRVDGGSISTGIGALSKVFSAKIPHSIHPQKDLS